MPPDPLSTLVQPLFHHFKGSAAEFLLAAKEVAAKSSVSSFGLETKGENSEGRIKRHFSLPDMRREADPGVWFSSGVIILLLCSMNDCKRVKYTREMICSKLQKVHLLQVTEGLTSNGERTRLSKEPLEVSGLET